MAITLEQAKKLTRGTVLHHVVRKNADGTPMRVRVNGAVKLWKKDPERIRVPLKHGLSATGYLVNGTNEGGRFEMDLKEVNLSGGVFSRDADWVWIEGDEGMGVK